MSEQLFEIAFKGQIVEGADLEKVKQVIGLMFKADASRLAQLFSGNRVIIKRSVDQATAARYRGAFEKAGAICEVVALGEPKTQPQKPATAVQAKESANSTESSAEYTSRYPESEQIPPALLTEPLGVRAEEIEDLGVDIAPVGSMVQDQIREVPEPDIDTSGLDIAPVGSVLSTAPEKKPPPPPDTAGLSLADN